MTSPPAPTIRPHPAADGHPAPANSGAEIDLTDATTEIDLTDSAPAPDRASRSTVGATGDGTAAGDGSPTSVAIGDADDGDPPPLRHRNCLDGVRGIAVLTVVFFHLDLGWMSGGYLGVDVFFVLSGFLITTLLVREWTEHGRIDLKRFWVRRARRLLPAMLVVLGGVALFALFFAEPEQLGDIRRQGIASLFYVTNWARAFDNVSYFDAFAAKSPLEHYWSLAIEEQFYVVWPLITIALFTWRAKAADTVGRARRLDLPLWLVGVGGAIASAGLMAALYSPENSSLYFRTDTRVQGLLIGVALAGLYDGVGRRLMRTRPSWMVPAGWVAGLAFLVVCVTDVAPAWLYQGGFLVV
ncbi:MAG: acyltransferase, partial [Microthrixaceae bacterium]|nr:acyltransferase [Microthrixaceae bacterium]